MEELPVHAGTDPTPRRERPQMRTFWLPTGAVAALVTLAPALGGQAAEPLEAPTRVPRPAPAVHFPLVFVENDGQFADNVHFQARMAGLSASVLSDGWAFSGESARMRVRFEGSSDAAAVQGEDERAARANFLPAGMPNQARSESSSSETLRSRIVGRVRIENLLDGVDALLFESDGRLEYDLHVAPGVDASTIVFRLEGVERSVIGADGALVAESSGRRLRQNAPRTWQVHRDGTEELLPSAFRSLGDHRFGFVVEGRDPELPLVIDPVLVFSEFIGGSNADEAYDIAVDEFGAIYVTGWATSGDFPFGTSPIDAKRKGREAVVFKLDPTGTEMVYATFLGGRGDDEGRAIAVNVSGEAFVVGTTKSADFPTTRDAFGRRKVGNFDAFAVRLSEDGSELLYATYLGGSQDDTANAIALGSDDSAYIVGSSRSADFPTTSFSLQPRLRGARDAFLVKLDAEGKFLAFSTLLGGTRDDEAFDVVIDGSGRAYVGGRTESADFPTTVATLDRTRNSVDGFVTKFNGAAASLAYSTFLGGSDQDEVHGVALDEDEALYAVGWTNSRDFPTTVDAFVEGNPGRTDGFVTRLSPSGASVSYSTYLGGSAIDRALGVDIDAFGTPWVVGETRSKDFPVTLDADQDRLGGAKDAFLIGLDEETGEQVFGTYLGGRGDESARAVAVQPLTENVLLAGMADEIAPARRGALSGRHTGPSDALIARYEPGFCGTRAERVTLGSSCGAQLQISTPRLGRTLRIEVIGAPPLVSGTLYSSEVAEGPIQVEDLCELHLDPATTRSLKRFVTDEDGRFVLEVKIPRSGLFCGKRTTVQARIEAPSYGPLSFGQLTQGIELSFGD